MVDTRNMFDDVYGGIRFEPWMETVKNLKMREPVSTPQIPKKKPLDTAGRYHILGEKAGVFMGTVRDNNKLVTFPTQAAALAEAEKRGKNNPDVTYTVVKAVATVKTSTVTRITTV